MRVHAAAMRFVPLLLVPALFYGARWLIENNWAARREPIGIISRIEFCAIPVLAFFGGVLVFAVVLSNLRPFASPFRTLFLLGTSVVALVLPLAPFTPTPEMNYFFEHRELFERAVGEARAGRVSPAPEFRCQICFELTDELSALSNAWGYITIVQHSFRVSFAPIDRFQQIVYVEEMPQPPTCEYAHTLMRQIDAHWLHSAFDGSD